MNGKMSKQNTQPTIAELWREFQKLMKVSKRNPLYWSNQWDKRNIRSQLIERCKRVDESGGYYTLFTLDEFVIAVHCKPNGSPKHRREDSSETAREMSAAYAFWAWEREQRQKEATPPQVIP